MQALFYQAYYSYRGLNTWLSWSALASNVLIRPILMMILFAIVGRFAWNEAAAQSFIVGMIAYAATTQLSGGITQCLAHDRDYGTLPFLFVSAGSRLVTYFSRSFLHYPLALLCFLGCVASAALFLGLDVGRANWVAVLAVFPVIALSVSCFALCLGSFSIAFRNWTVPTALAEAILLLLTGIVIPRQSLPLAARIVSDGLPISHALDGLRRAFSGADVTAIRLDLGIEAGVAVAYAVVGFLVFRTIETYARRSGTYDRG